jgi:hypothetical protein
MAAARSLNRVAMPFQPGNKVPASTAGLAGACLSEREGITVCSSRFLDHSLPFRLSQRALIRQTEAPAAS